MKSIQVKGLKVAKEDQMAERLDDRRSIGTMVDRHKIPLLLCQMICAMVERHDGQ